MADYKTPDVYVEEISTLPPSVAEVSTAIPVFMGYTEKATYNNKLLINVPTRITSFLEFKTIFGEPFFYKFDVTVLEDSINVVRNKGGGDEHNLFYSLDHYFRNGGGDCYIVTLGAYQDKTTEAFEDGIDALLTEDEPTLIILSEATALSAPDYNSLCQRALDQCSKLKDRFCIFDVVYDPAKGTRESASDFRNAISGENMSYGAAYYPYLETTLNYKYREEDVTVIFSAPDFIWGQLKISSPVSGINNRNLAAVQGEAETNIKFTFTNGKLSIAFPKGKTYKEIMDALNDLKDFPKDYFTLSLHGDGNTVATELTSTGFEPSVQLDTISKTHTALYNSIKQEINKQRCTLPPSPAIAGVYASVDRNRGVWKAPANVALSSVIAPTAKISSGDQEDLNIDTTGGKSINAIRGFLGKGTLVWGARTLAGNDNEWRYVNVRRLFSMIEESTKKASYFAVFEPNTATTWLKVKGMIESFLYRLWQQGALAGSTPKAAYFVNVGLGTTMTQQDILEGRMIIEVGIAAVRPAEFIILRFSHKLQEV